MSITNYNITEFDFNTVPENATAIIVAPRGSGKTVFLKDAVYHLRDRFDKVYLFSSTYEYQEDAFNYIPKENKFKGFDMPALNKILERQDKAYDEIKRLNPKDKEPKKKLDRILLLFDDIINEPTIRENTKTSPNVLNKISSIYRHKNISCWVISQVAGCKFGIPSTYLINCDIYIILKTHCSVTRDLLAERALSYISKKEGLSLLSEITSVPYRACVVNLRTVGINSYSDYIFWYIASDKVPKFMIKNTLTKADTIINGGIIKANGEVKKRNGLNLVLKVDHNY